MAMFWIGVIVLIGWGLSNVLAESRPLGIQSRRRRRGAYDDVTDENRRVGIAGATLAVAALVLGAVGPQLVPSAFTRAGATPRAIMDGSMPGTMMMGGMMSGAVGGDRAPGNWALAVVDRLLLARARRLTGPDQDDWVTPGPPALR